MTLSFPRKVAFPFKVLQLLIGFNFLEIVFLPESVSLAGLFVHSSPLLCFFTLRHIEANPKEPSSSRTDEDPLFSGLLVELGLFPPQNTLESLSISMDVFSGTESLPILKDDFQCLVAFFARGSFSRLKNVTVAIDWFRRNSEDRSILSDLESSLSHDLYLYFTFTFVPRYQTRPSDWQFDLTSLDHSALDSLFLQSSTSVACS